MPISHVLQLKSNTCWWGVESNDIHRGSLCEEKNKNLCIFCHAGKHGFVPRNFVPLEHKLARVAPLTCFFNPRECDPEKKMIADISCFIEKNNSFPVFCSVKYSLSLNRQFPVLFPKMWLIEPPQFRVKHVAKKKLNTFSRCKVLLFHTQTCIFRRVFFLDHFANTKTAVNRFRFGSLFSVVIDSLLLRIHTIKAYTYIVLFRRREMGENTSLNLKRESNYKLFFPLLIFGPRI